MSMYIHNLKSNFHINKLVNTLYGSMFFILFRERVFTNMLTSMVLMWMDTGE